MINTSNTTYNSTGKTADPPAYKWSPNTMGNR